MDLTTLASNGVVGGANAARAQAVLELKDCRAEMQQEATLNQPSQSAIPGVSALANVVQNTANAMRNGASVTAQGPVTRCFYVQFNPSELKLDANAQTTTRQDGETERVHTDGQCEPRISLETTIYFDDVQPYDAFMAEKLTLNPSTGAVANVVNTGKTIAGTNVHTVQPEVEALIAALRNAGARRVTFRWADFVFVGILESVQATYTMFSVSGRPVRAKVVLRLQHDSDSANIQSWYDAYDTAFGNMEKNLTKFQQKASNLLNLNL